MVFDTIEEWGEYHRAYRETLAGQMELLQDGLRPVRALVSEIHAEWFAGLAPWHRVVWLALLGARVIGPSTMWVNP